MAINRVVNRSKLSQLVALNVAQKATSTSIASKPNKVQPIATVTEINEGNKRGAKRGMTLIDEDDDEDDEILQGNRVDMEVDDVDQDYEYENVEDTIYTNIQHEIQMTNHYYSEDEEQLQGLE
ncbi:uncharacterized protein LOC143615053 [Bidens hawaiensis]|uniref:uncharacterized protein LOC143615053 n=1 Tax=Bidens hawaiensis TaxID=980011 RepID=UPI0040494F11